MLSEADGDLWIYRRDRRITMPLTRFTKRAADGTPFVAPEVQLVFKSGARRRDKDDADFETALPKLDDESQRWLAEAIALSDDGHPWLTRLAARRRVQAGGIIE